MRGQAQARSRRLWQQVMRASVIIAAVSPTLVLGGRVVHVHAATPTASGPASPGLCASSATGTTFQPSCAAVVVGPAASAGAATPCATAVMQCPVWSDTYDGPATSVDMAFAAATDSHGSRLFAGGDETDSTTSFPGVVIAYDMATGTRQWVSKHAGTLQALLVSSLQASADGSAVYVAGDEYSGGFAPCGTDVYALDGATGAVRWDSPLPIGDGGCPLYVDSALSADGSRLFVISDIRESAVQTQGQDVEQAITAAFDTATGQQLWLSRAPLTGYGYEHWRIAASSDGSNVYVASGTNSATPLSPVSWSVFAYAAATGAPEWTTVYDCTRNGGQFCTEPAAISTASGHVYVLGGNGTSQLLALSTQSGQRLWETDLSPQQFNFVYVLNHPLVAAANGDVYAGYYMLDQVTTGPQTTNTGESFVTARVSGADGAVVWTTAMAGNTPGDGTYCAGCGPILAIDPSDSHVYVSGAYPLGDSLLTTESLAAASGVVEWSGLYAWSEGALVDQLPEAIVAPPQGGAAIVGGANNATDTNPVVTCSICYDFAALVYPGAASAPADVPDTPVAVLLPLAGIASVVALRRGRGKGLIRRCASLAAARGQRPHADARREE